jgi:hypothetical protein
MHTSRKSILTYNAIRPDGERVMSIRTKIKDPNTGNSVDMDLESDNTVEDVIESAVSFWTKEPGPYVLKWEKKLLRGDLMISEVGIKDGDSIELIADPQGG